MDNLGRRWRKARASMNHGACAEAASWRKAAASLANNNCVEAGHAPGIIGVRDSRSPAMVLEFTPAAWTAFTMRLRG